MNSEDLLLDPVKRLIQKPVAAPINEAAEMKVFPHDYTLLLIGRASDEITGMLTSLAADEHRIVRLSHGPTLQVLDDGRYEADLSSLETIQELRTTLMERGNKVGAIINVTALAEKSDAVTESDYTDDIKHLFLMLKVFGDDLLSSVEAGAGWLVNFTAMDGQFGLKGKGSFSPGQAGSVGIMKTAAREWPSIKVKSVDLDPEADPQLLATKVLQELALFDDLVEVGLDEEGRWRIDLEESIPFSKVRSLRLIDEQSVLLVTGGAYGITSEVTKALASKYQPRIILVGRSLLPEGEHPEIQGLQGSQNLRQYFIKAAKQEKKPVTPAAIEKQVLQVLKARAIRKNIEEMTAAGATVEYRALDVRNADHFGALMDSIYEKYGRIDGVIHGAGVNEDKLIKDKSIESFNRVLETKVIPAKVLAERLRPEGLKFMVFFSSVAGRFGNVGQSDYSAANEVLNKLAVHLTNSWPAHVTAINWGPWESGMVTEDLGKLFAERGIHLIPTAEGVRMFLEELHNSGDCTPEVVISRSVKEISETRV
jgi:NAD(P)-dependent dehydrogenase (short-subunit alcohol dehydrogenase family)